MHHLDRMKQFATVKLNQMVQMEQELQFINSKRIKLIKNVTSVHHKKVMSNIDYAYD